MVSFGLLLRRVKTVMEMRESNHKGRGNPAGEGGMRRKG